ncbi:hypothetical protein [Corynebacterium sp. HMSC036E10]|uniref:hypothetical protein n=1 Tax=Corynebacterium sp. HMSC036E10 TaxID=1715215 RepID=UPI00114CEB5E|nr:hypothetical protein [Corynebacterium sp. HMSC036E10]
MNTTTKTAGLVTAIAVALGAATATPIAEAQTPNLVQGERFTIKRSDGKWSYCTVGYVDTERKIFYTAAHCMRDKEAEAYLNDRTTYLGKPILVGDWGFIGGSNTENDYAVIDYSNAEGVVGSNPYSTKLANKEDITPGKRVCSYGAKTPEVRCADIVQINDYGPNRAHVVLKSPTEFSQPGDSGSPVWLEDTGEYIGTLAGTGHQYSGVTYIPRHGQRRGCQEVCV